MCIGIISICELLISESLLDINESYTFLMKEQKNTTFSQISNILASENFGKLFLRVMIGSYFIALGVKHFAGGWSMIETLGKIFSTIGITFLPKMFGVVSALILILSGMCFLIGFFFKANAFLLFVIFLIKSILYWKISHNYWNVDFLYSFILSIVLISCIFIGPGKYSSDKQ